MWVIFGEPGFSASIGGVGATSVAVGACSIEAILLFPLVDGLISSVGHC
jgi:hypothetical protein